MKLKRLFAFACLLITILSIISCASPTPPSTASTPPALSEGNQSFVPNITIPTASAPSTPSITSGSTLVLVDGLTGNKVTLSATFNTDGSAEVLNVSDWPDLDLSSLSNTLAVVGSTFTRHFGDNTFSYTATLAETGKIEVTFSDNLCVGYLKSGTTNDWVCFNQLNGDD